MTTLTPKTPSTEKAELETTSPQDVPTKAVSPQSAAEMTALSDQQVGEWLKETEKNSPTSLNPVILHLDKVSVAYSPEKFAVKDVTANIYDREVTAIMGPSGCGKSTLLRAINRMHALYKGISVTGRMEIAGEDLLSQDPMRVRRRIGMVFQQPNPFPTMSIADNVLAGFKLNGVKLSKRERHEIVETSLRNVGLWDEVKDRLEKKGSFLSGGQQQRLCIARAMAQRPEILLMDEPTSALDPIATKRIEDLILELKSEIAIVIVTHNMSQAARISDKSMFMYLGELIEYDLTNKMFTNPSHKKTEEYLSGNFG